MIDGTNLNRIGSTRQMLRAFGGLNEGYGCSEAEFAQDENFSSRGYPALQTRLPRRWVKQVGNLNGMYHLNGVLLCQGKNLKYYPGSIESEYPVDRVDVVTDSRKTLVGMGRNILIFPDQLVFDTGYMAAMELEARWENGERSLIFEPCDAEGNVYRAHNIGTTEPEHPVDGELFLKVKDTSHPYRYDGVLKQYSEKNGSWGVIELTHCRILGPGLNLLFEAGQTVKIDAGSLPSGWKVNGNRYIEATGSNWLMVSITPEGDMFFGAFIKSASAAQWVSTDGKRTEKLDGETCVIERKLPVLNYVTECNNRLFGCNGIENTIYASALGDPWTWYTYQGIDTDSYTVNVGSDGYFTGVASWMGQVLFFKENCIHRLYGSKPSDYQLTTMKCPGVAQGAAGSICVIGNVLYYLSPDGVMAWDGSMPVKISDGLDGSRLKNVERAEAGSMDGKLYLCVKTTGEPDWRMLVYDTGKGIWHEEKPACRGLMSAGAQLYLWDGSDLFAADPDRDDSGTGAVETLDFCAVSGDMGLGVPDDKYIGRVTVRLDAAQDSTVALAVSYDGGAWQELTRCEVHEKYERLNVPFVPVRCDTMRLKISGTG